jgi:serine/threonine-protein kinase RsbW
MNEIRGMECAAGKEFEIELALQEALANAVVHGCEEDPCKEVQISVGCDKQRGVLVVVRDPGGGFDPDQLPSPVIGEAIFEDHGRGIFLINRLMDEVDFRKGGAEIRMRKRGPAAR